MIADEASRRKTVRRRNQRQLTSRIEDWFAVNARDLPWRRERSGYHALVSEIMLQQTQVSRVVPAYQRFIRRFSTPRALASAPEQQVLSMWEGLGYYRRARHLQQAAREIVATHRGVVPDQFEELLSLPGVGRYTAGAIASIVFGRHVPAVDGNVHRVMSRIEGWRGDASDRRALQRTQQACRELVEVAQDVGKLNEGLMELGALICTPGRPNCAACPVRSMCSAHRSGDPESFPDSKPRQRCRTVYHNVVLVHSARRILMRRRASDGMWAEMWEPFTVETHTRLSSKSLAELVPLKAPAIHRLETFEHQTTHRRVVFVVYRCQIARAGRSWKSISEAMALPMSVPQRRIMRTWIHDSKLGD